MHCKACDVELSDYESTRKDLRGDYIDLCNHCYLTIKDDLVSIEREDLSVPLDFTQYSED
jgi:hypothetical protein